LRVDIRFRPIADIALGVQCCSGALILPTIASAGMSFVFGLIAVVLAMAAVMAGATLFHLKQGPFTPEIPNRALPRTTISKAHIQLFTGGAIAVLAGLALVLPLIALVHLLGPNSAIALLAVIAVAALLMVGVTAVMISMVLITFRRLGM
jgi:hypothetical protein